MLYNIPNLVEKMTFYVGDLGCNYNCWYYVFTIFGLLWPYSIWVESKISRFDVAFMKVVMMWLSYIIIHSLFLLEVVLCVNQWSRLVPYFANEVPSVQLGHSVQVLLFLADAVTKRVELRSRVQDQHIPRTSKRFSSFLTNKEGISILTAFVDTIPILYQLIDHFNFLLSDSIAYSDLQSAFVCIPSSSWWHFCEIVAPV